MDGILSDEKNNAIVDHLLAELTFEAGDEESSEGADEAFAGMNFVITGSLEHFKNRKELQELIERRGGKVTGSVTSKTNYLINNDVASSSSKNKKARELGVPILSEEELFEAIREVQKAGRLTVFSWHFFAACVMIRNADIVLL